MFEDRAETSGEEPDLRALELFCGIGGFAAAVAGRARVVVAVDINRRALEVYRANFAHPVAPLNVEGLSVEQMRSWAADLWWLSPPCQPFTRRGRGRDLDDPRARGLLRVIELLQEVSPDYLALENVPAFAGSRTHRRLRRALERKGFHLRESILCPTELGIPNRRRRFYLVAGRRPLTPPSKPATDWGRLRAFLDEVPSPDLWVEAELASDYRHALDVVEPGEPEAVAACFTSAYGRSPVRSGSYLRTADGLRRFSPREILRLLGYPEDFALPSDMPLQAAWRLVGNGLSVPAVRRVLEAIPGLRAA